MTESAEIATSLPAFKLHANWHLSWLYVWGTAAGAAALATADLREAVGELTSDSLIASVAGDTTLALWLPSGSNGSSTLAVQTVPALQLSPADAIDLLSSLPSHAPDTCGPSFLYWAAMTRFALSRIAAGQFYPDIDQPRADAFVGLWRSLIGGGPRLEQLTRFAAAMPPSCRAIANGESTDPSAILESFLTTTVDSFVRRAVSNDDFFARVHELAHREESTGDVRWLSSLLGTDRTVVSHSGNSLMADQVRGWINRLDEARGKQSWRLCFELIEPEFDEEDPTTEAAALSAAAAERETPAAESPEAATDAVPEAATSVIDELDGQDAIWTLKFVLESGGDEIQRQDAAELWADPADPAGIIGRSISERRAHLMAELQRSVDICSPVSRALESSTPSFVSLTTNEAHQFMRQWAGRLLDNAFGVVVPEWAKDRSQRLGMLLEVRPEYDKDGDELPPELSAAGLAAGGKAQSPTQLSSGKFGLDSLLDFDWRIAVGELRLSPAEFQQIAGSGVPLVRYRGKWMEIDQEAAGRMVEFMAKKNSGKMTLAEAFRTAFGINRANDGVPIIGISGASWVDNFLQQTPAASIENLKQPTEFKGTLRNYQLRGLDWLSFLDRLGIGACLADALGLGKTIQLISLLLHEREILAANTPAGQEVPRVGPTLLFAPTSVVGNWVKELDRFAKPLKVLIHHGPERESGDRFAQLAMENDVVITSYALAHRDLEDLKRPTWHRIALDEAQKIKNPSAAAAVAIRSLVAMHRVAMTGTPIENHLSELWSIMEMLNPGLLGTASEFRERFAVPIAKLAARDRAMQLREMIRPFVLRRTKTDPQVAADLPEKMEMKVFCNLSAEQAAIYERITSDMLGQIDSAKGIRRRGLILAALTRLKQVCNHPVLALKDPDAPRSAKKHSASIPVAQLFGRSGKCERLLEMLEEVIEEGDAAIIFTQYREMGHLLESMITERLHQPVQFLHGGTPALGRDAMIERFQKPGSDIRLFLLSLRAGGLGLNLTAANHVFHFDRWWNPAVESQATDRAHRIGQTRKVQVHKFVCVGTLEERIDRLLSDKLALADQIVSSGDEWLTNLSTDELRRYLSLSREAVAEF
ncbi:DEAD/DEAH box helicase [soil metagenome]